MRINARKLAGLLCFAVADAAIDNATAQAPTIQSLSANGHLRASQLEPGTSATIEWAPEITGPWSDNWDSLKAVAVEADGTLEARVPMFFRLRGVPANPDPARLVWIPPGTFIMGSPENEPDRELLVPITGVGDETQHEVTIGRGFWMGQYEVTQEDFLEVIGTNPSHFSGANLPVESVTWYESVAYCDQLTLRERSAGRLPDGYVYRLPTEAEWEYACRAGTSTVFHYGDELRSGMANFRGTLEYSLAEGGTVANPAGVDNPGTVPVGSYTPNAWGLFDMHGNVREYCFDWVAPYPASAVTDPVVLVPPFPSDNAKIERGGGWSGQRGGASAEVPIETSISQRPGTTVTASASCWLNQFPDLPV